MPNLEHQQQQILLATLKIPKESRGFLFKQTFCTSGYVWRVGVAPLAALTLTTSPFWKARHDYTLQQTGTQCEVRSLGFQNVQCCML